MRTTKKERQDARKDCEFHHSGYCVTKPCFCLVDLREQKKRFENFNKRFEQKTA